MAFSTSLNDLLSRCGDESESESELRRARGDRSRDSDLREEPLLLEDDAREDDERGRCLLRGGLDRLGLTLSLSRALSPAPP